MNPSFPTRRSSELYGPSGLPHIGTFGEVARTNMVRRAYEILSDTPTRLVAFSDDMDGLRKVPDNVPNQEMMAQHLGKPLTQVPDPFGKFESRSEEHTSELQSLMRISYAVFCLQKKTKSTQTQTDP